MNAFETLTRIVEDGKVILNFPDLPNGTKVEFQLKSIVHPKNMDQIEKFSQLQTN